MFHCFPVRELKIGWKFTPADHLICDCGGQDAIVWCGCGCGVVHGNLAHDLECVGDVVIQGDRGHHGGEFLGILWALAASGKDGVEPVAGQFDVNLHENLAGLRRTGWCQNRVHVMFAQW
jgi:hypothetical protein